MKHRIDDEKIEFNPEKAMVLDKMYSDQRGACGIWSIALSFLFAAQIKSILTLLSDGCHFVDRLVNSQMSTGIDCCVNK
jgi:hypothetical protein